MPELYGFVDAQIRALEQRLRDHLRGALPREDMARAARSVIDGWNALPEEVRRGTPEAHEDILWHAVWTMMRRPEGEQGGGGVDDPLLHECLHLLEARAPLPQHYSARRP